MAAERRHLRAEQLAWVCKAALAASDVRRKARAWRLWRQVQVSSPQRTLYQTTKPAHTCYLVLVLLPDNVWMGCYLLLEVWMGSTVAPTSLCCVVHT